jgi:thiazole synthase
MLNDTLMIAEKPYQSRLLVGTGKYASLAQTKDALAASGAQIVTVALRRINLADKSEGSIASILEAGKYTLLPNSAGCYTADDAVRTLRLAREISNSPLIKLEVIGDPHTLYPDVEQTLEAAKILVREGFHVMAYTTDDLIAARKLEDIGCVAVMPLAAPIGSGLGILNPLNIRLIAETLKVPVLVDAGIGTASDACLAMELGCAGVLLNTALSSARDPILMAESMKNAVISGRQAYLAGRMPRREMAVASSPELGKVGSS